MPNKLGNWKKIEVFFMYLKMLIVFGTNNDL